MNELSPELFDEITNRPPNRRPQNRKLIPSTYPAGPGRNHRLLIEQGVKPLFKWGLLWDTG